MMYFKISRLALAEIIWDQMFQGLANNLFNTPAPMSEAEFPVMGSLNFSMLLQPMNPRHRAIYAELVDMDDSEVDRGVYLVVASVPNYPLIYPAYAPLDPWNDGMGRASFNVRVAVPGDSPEMPGYVSFESISTSPPVIEVSIVFTLAKREDIRDQRHSGPYSGPRKHIKLSIRLAVVIQRTTGTGTAEALVNPVLAMAPLGPNNAYRLGNIPMARISVLSGPDLTEVGDAAFVNLPPDFARMVLNVGQLLNVGSLATSRPGNTLVNMGAGCSIDTFYIGLDFAESTLAAQTWGSGAIGENINRWERFYHGGLFPTEELVNSVRSDRPAGEWGVSFSGDYFASLFRSSSPTQQVSGRWTSSGLMVDCRVILVDGCPLFPFDMEVTLEYSFEIRFDAGDNRSIIIDLILRDSDLDFWDSVSCFGTLSFLIALAFIPMAGFFGSIAGAVSLANLFTWSAGITVSGAALGGITDLTEADDLLIASQVRRRLAEIQRGLTESSRTLFAGATVTANNDGDLRVRTPLSALLPPGVFTPNPAVTSIGIIGWAGYDTTAPNRTAVEFRGAVDRPSLPRTVQGSSIYRDPLIFRSRASISIARSCSPLTVRFEWILKVENPTRYDVIIQLPRLRAGSPWINLLRFSDLPETDPPSYETQASRSPRSSDNRLLRIIGGKSAYFSFSTPLKHVQMAQASLGGGEIDVVIRSNRGQFLYRGTEASQFYSASIDRFAESCSLSAEYQRMHDWQSANTVPGSGGSGNFDALANALGTLDLNTLNLPGLSAWTERLDDPTSPFRLDPSIEPQQEHTLASATALEALPGTQQDPILRAILGRNGNQS